MTSQGHWRMFLNRRQGDRQFDSCAQIEAARFVMALPCNTVPARFVHSIDDRGRSLVLRRVVDVFRHFEGACCLCLSLSLFFATPFCLDFCIFHMW
jgi:hypothetical protein